MTLNARIHFKSKFTDICVQNSINSGDSNNNTTNNSNNNTSSNNNNNNECCNSKSACIK